LIPFHCAVISSTRIARSSTRALRSIRRSVSRRSEAPDHLIREALDLGEPAWIGAASSRRPSRSALRRRRKDDLELVGGLGERLDLEPRAVERGGDVGRE
jgi:hypothetical protein